MQLRVVVMAGRVALQQADDKGTWSHVSIQRCEAVKSGLYTLHNAPGPEPGRSYSGSVLAQHEGSLYQLVGKNVVRHTAPTDIKLSVGDKVQLDYSADLSRPSARLVETANVKQRRVKSRKI
jgi:hypothetical protein